MDIRPYPKNAKKHPKKQIEQIASSIKEFGMNQPIVVDKEGVIIVGHGRYEAMKLLGLEITPDMIKVVDLPEKKANAYRLADNKLNESDWDMELVIEELKALEDESLAELTGFDLDLLPKYRDEMKRSLQDDYIIPPFSIWDTKQKYWQDRKRLWIKYIGYSGTGRDDNLLGDGLKKLAQGAKQNYKNETALTGTSIFDPVVAEISYRWFCPESGHILDPFAGGHVRGSVAGVLGYPYTGVDLSKKQIRENRKKSKELDLNINYINGDSLSIDKLVKEEQFDMIFSCPPYFDLEKYEDGEGDLSMTKDYYSFRNLYREIIKKSCLKLKENRFAVWVIGDVRDKDGRYYGLINDTIDAFRDCGLSLYNEVILANAIATASLRARKPFENRKVTKVHQNILCFYKGKANTAKWFGNLPKIEAAHNKAFVFYKGDIEEIRKNYKVIDTDLSFQDDE